MAKDTDQNRNDWQQGFYQDTPMQLGRIDRYIKEGVTFLSCSLSPFIFWLVVNHLAWVGLKVHTSKFSLLPQIIKTAPYKKLTLSAVLIIVASVFLNHLLKKIAFKNSNFPLLRLFPKDAVKNPSSASRR